jgi:uncharacterized protein YcaQ
MDDCSNDWSDIVTPDMLTRRVTLGEYFADSIEGVRKGYITQGAVDQDRARLETQAQPSDEWWEWVLGTEPLRQMGGLALVRRGNIIWARNDWIS